MYYHRLVCNQNFYPLPPPFPLQEKVPKGSLVANLNYIMELVCVMTLGPYKLAIKIYIFHNEVLSFSDVDTLLCHHHLCHNLLIFVLCSNLLFLCLIVVKTILKHFGIYIYIYIYIYEIYIYICPDKYMCVCARARVYVYSDKQYLVAQVLPLTIKNYRCFRPNNI